MVDWDPLPTSPFAFFNPEGNAETAQAAFKNVLSDAGCTLPRFDNHDKRMVREALNGTTSTVGSRSGKKGLIDSEEDTGCEGFDLEKLGITTESRPSDWDTDQDGMPDWFEELKGTNPHNADNNEDPDGDGYTNLEDYLNWMAEPNYQVAESTEINLADWFAHIRRHRRHNQRQPAYCHPIYGQRQAVFHQGYSHRRRHLTYPPVQLCTHDRSHRNQ